jgi:hypothetical protein
MVKKNSNSLNWPFQEREGEGKDAFNSAIVTCRNQLIEIDQGILEGALTSP